MITGKSVYIIKNNTTGFVKIGVTNDLKRRLNLLSTSCGCEMTLIYYTPPINNFSKIELNMHEDFSGYRGIGEWFDVDEKMVIKKLKSRSSDFELCGFADMYKKGKKIGEIAVFYNVTYQYIHKLVTHFGLDESPEKASSLSEITYKNTVKIPTGTFKRIKKNIYTNGRDFKVSVFLDGKMSDSYFKSIDEAETHLRKMSKR
jgi:hypothetical protein